jgi:serine/threonine-protein kinase RsbW
MRNMGPEEARSACAFGRTVPAVAGNVAPIRHAVVDLADRGGAAEEVSTDIALAVGEACANVVVHAYPPGDVGPLIVHAEIKGPQIFIQVCDQGQGMTPRPDSPGLGLGLPLIANLSDHLEIHDGPGKIGTVLEMTFKLARG